MSIRAADAVIDRYLARAQVLITMRTAEGRRAARDLLQMLAEADWRMADRLRRWLRTHGGPTARFTEASLVAYRAELADVIAYVRAGLRGLTDAQAMAAARISARRTARVLADLEGAFTGIARPLRLDEAIVMRVRPSLLARHATSVDRYGEAMIGAMQRAMAQGLVEGVSQGEMVDRLVTLRGPTGAVSLRAVEIQPGMVVRLAEEQIPEGLFVRYRSWAWRIVRTEVAEAQNATCDQAISEARAEFPDLKRKILAVMDQRTAWDSIVVHGQVRGEQEYFRDGAGREYLRPPARPHDRETLVPWRTGWPDTPHSRELGEGERTAMWSRNEKWQAERARRRRGRAWK